MVHGDFRQLEEGVQPLARAHASARSVISAISGPLGSAYAFMSGQSRRAGRSSSCR
jgi:hypothetical protein